MRYSKQRELVLRKVEELCDHPTAEEIFDKAAPECPGLSLGTVYRNLNSLVEAGRVRRVSIPGKADRFDHTLRWHSHLYCNACGRCGRKAGDEAGPQPEGRRAGLRGGPVRPVRGLRPKAGRSLRLNRKIHTSYLPCGAKQGILKGAF